MAEFYRQLQEAIWLAASTIHVWRDLAILALAALVIGLLLFAHGAHADG